MHQERLLTTKVGSQTDAGERKCVWRVDIHDAIMTRHIFMRKYIQKYIVIN